MMQPDPIAAMRHQQATMQRLQQIVQTALGDALSLLATGYQATVLFTFKGRPERDIVITQTSFEDVLSSLLAKATPAQVAAIQNKDTSSNKPLVSGPTPEDRLAAVRKAMAFLPHMPATSFFREQMTKALSMDVPTTAPVPNVAPASDGPRDELDVEASMECGAPCYKADGELRGHALVDGSGTAALTCPNCGSHHLFKALGSGHIMCEECDCDLTECAQ